MKRRNFFGATVGSAAALAGLAGCEKTTKTSQPTRSVPLVTDDNGRLAGFTLEELREQYRYDLLDDYMPFISLDKASQINSVFDIHSLLFCHFINAL